MTVVCPADADEAARLMEQTLDWPGPIYIRLAKGGDAIVSKAEHGFAIGKAILMRPAGDVLMVTTRHHAAAGTRHGRSLGGAGHQPPASCICTP